MIDIICQLRFFLILSGLCLVLGMRDWPPVISGSILFILLAFWAIDWLAKHISLRWLRYLKYGFAAAIVAAIIIVPQLRETVLELGRIFFSGLIELSSARLIVLSIVFLITHAVLCWSQPAVRVNT
ncbi:MAG TPA: hypothetical protein VMP08_17510 [Anaerolineae bacterium]|nr:hypothetical protein [Anaerolineae bacterium]